MIGAPEFSAVSSGQRFCSLPPRSMLSYLLQLFREGLVPVLLLGIFCSPALSFLTLPTRNGIVVAKHVIWIGNLGTQRTNLLPPRRTMFIVSATGEEVDLLSSTKDELYRTYPLPSQRFNVSLSSYSNLMSLIPGECIASESFTATATDGTHHLFRLLVYPKGGASNLKRIATPANQAMNLASDAYSSKDDNISGGFGMSYKILPMFQASQERVGVYLQYLPKLENETVDVTFDIRLLGQQLSGPRFDVEWSAGMRFAKHGDLRDGIASDFGAHLLQTCLLWEFMGAERGTDDPLRAQVRLTLHPPIVTRPISLQNTNVMPQWLPSFLFGDIRPLQGTLNVHDQHQVRVGKIVVPVLQKLHQRPRMFQAGVYPGVEYRIMRIFPSSSDHHEIFGSQPGADYELKPLYPLVSSLERPWPIRVPEKAIPKLVTPNQYNIVSALGSLVTAASALLSAFLVSQLISLYVIPSRSMDPTLLVGDVLLVEKISPRIHRLTPPKTGNVVLFHPPPRLQELVMTAQSGGSQQRILTDRDLFVKRVAAEPGDVVTVDRQGNLVVRPKGDTPSSNSQRDVCEAEPLKLIERYIIPQMLEIPEKEVFVAGDCGSVSIDSRVWGTLPVENIVGKPLFRVWPWNRFGTIGPLPSSPIQPLPSIETTPWSE